MSNPIAVPGTNVPASSLFTPGGAQGAAGPQGTAGAPGPTAVSTDFGNLAILGSDSKVWVPKPSQTLVRFGMLENHPPASAYATFNTRNSLAVLDFLKTGNLDSSAVFMGVIPQGVSWATGLQVYLYWASVTATTGNVEWSLAIDNLNGFGVSHSIDTDSYGTAVTGVGAPNSTAANLTTTTMVIPTANLQSLGAEQAFKLKITRKASDTVNDTMADTADLLMIEIKAY